MTSYIIMNVNIYKDTTSCYQNITTLKKLLIYRFNVVENYMISYFVIDTIIATINMTKSLSFGRKSWRHEIDNLVHYMGFGLICST